MKNREHEKEAKLHVGTTRIYERRKSRTEKHACMIPEFSGFENEITRQKRKSEQHNERISLIYTKHLMNRTSACRVQRQTR